MNILHIPGMFFSPHGGWDDLLRQRPSPTRLFFTLVLPMAVLPPAMIILGASGIGAAYFPQVSFQAWLIAAMMLFVAELVSVPLMARIINAVAKSRGGISDFTGAWAVAAFAPLPMWLSSLALLQNHITVVVLTALAGLTGAAFLVRHGVNGVLRVREITAAGDVAFICICAGILAWMLLVGIVIAPILLAI